MCINIIIENSTLINLYGINLLTTIVDPAKVTNQR